MKLLVTVVIYFVLLQDVKGYGNGTHSEASKRCMENGGLASYKHFDIQNMKLTLNEEQANNLAVGDGESVWINGYAKFSTFLSLYGFYLGEKEYFKDTLNTPGNDIYVCSKYCMENKTDLKFIGLQRDMCICLASTEFKVENLLAYSDIQCKTVYGTEVADMPKLIKLYKIFKEEELFWKPEPPKLQQCVYVTVRNRTAYFATHSCLTLDSVLMVHGFICVRKNMTSNLNETCRRYHPPEGDTPLACFVEETSSAIHAKHRCCASNGKLIGSITRSLREYAPTSLTYWTGIFRSFVIEHNYNHDYACLAATKVDSNTLILDPDDCNVAKPFLCNDNLTNTHTTNTTESNTITDTKTWRIQNTKSDETIATKEKSEGTSTDTNEDLYIYVGVGAFVLLDFTVIIIVVVCRYRKSRIRVTQRKTEEKEKGNNVVYAEAYHLTALKDDTNNSHNPISEIENEQYDLAHQNYDSANQYDPASGASEYDKVNLKYRDKRDKVEHMGSNIYDQTKCVGDIDHYDVAGSSNDNRSQSNNDTDGTYSKFHTGDGDYDSLNQSKKEKLGSVSNESKGKTDNTYDTMK